MISVTILVKNGERRLSEVLQSLQSFDEIILFDTGSTDQTLEIASRYPNVSIYKCAFNGFGPAHNEAAMLAKYDWILSIDADEVVTPKLSHEIRSLSLDPGSIYALQRLNYFNGKQIKWCGWYPEQCIRLYNKRKTAFSETLVHEKVIKKDLKEILLTYPISHYPYETISDFLHKMQQYSSLFAEQNKYRRKASPTIALYHSFGAFFNSFVLKCGFLGGFESFLISLYHGHTAFYKYIKLYLANREESKSTKSY